VAVGGKDEPVSVVAPVSGLTYEALARWYPDDDGYRRELIDGELYVTPSPSICHQRVVLSLARRLADHADRHGAECLTAPFDMYLSPGDVPQPDVAYLSETTRARLDPAKLVGPADLVVEVSSPSTRRVDLLTKRRLYEQAGVPEYWVVDLEQDALLVHRRRGEVFDDPVVLRRGDRAVAPAADGFTVAVADVLGPEPVGPERD
jgi:Uma2 family endonuclease